MKNIGQQNNGNQSQNAPTNPGIKPKDSSNNQNQSTQMQQSGQGQHIKKDGGVDRRYSGHRDDPPEDQNENYTHAETGQIDDEGRHVTKDLAPDRRYKENRSLNEAEARQIQGENLQNDSSITNNSNNNRSNGR